MSFRFSDDVVAILERAENATAYAEAAIRAYAGVPAEPRPRLDPAGESAARLGAVLDSWVPPILIAPLQREELLEDLGEVIEHEARRRLDEGTAPPSIR
jgi:hypothetical protein